MIVLLAALALGLNIAVAVILVRKYMRTREAVFIWLGVAVVVWPFVSKMLDGGERILVDRVVKHQPVFYPFSRVESGDMTIGSLVMGFAIGQQLIGVVLLLVAVLYLYRTNTGPTVSS